MQDLCKALGGSGCTLLIANFNLIAQILMLVALWVGAYFAHTKQIPRHRRVQTTVVLVNVLLILFVMATSFYSFIIAGGTTTGIVATFMMIHGLLGLIAELTGIYLLIRMWRSKWLPQALRVKNFKRVMRTTLGLWTFLVLLGVGIYYFRYVAARESAPAAIVVTETATAVPPTPTAAPSATPAPTATPKPTAVPARGELTFANDKGLNDVATVKLSSVAAPAAGQVYQAWFASSNVALLAPVGEVKVGADGTANIVYHEPQAGNLIALYDQFFITSESGPATKPSSTMVFSGQIAAQLGGQVKLLLGSAADTPGHVGYIIGMHDNSDGLLAHAAELKTAAARGSLPAMKRHAEHLLNLLEGGKGKDYGDGDKNGAIEDPGDGFGYSVYAEQAALHAQAMADAPDATDAIKQRSAQMQTQAANVKKWTNTMLQDSLAVLAADNAQAVAAQAAETDGLADAVVRGQGQDGGFQQMFFTAQALAGLALTPLQAAPAAAAATQTLPTATPTLAATATATPAPKTVTVLMQGFSFKDKTITIDRGTTVIWPNKDNAKHTVTSDSGSPLNSKDIKATEQFSFTFTEAGTYPYYCEYHGDRGGVDMSGVVVVK
jgi:plastocyanin/uncharacterized membrane protein YozB (DUF420 family)